MFAFGERESCAALSTSNVYELWPLTPEGGEGGEPEGEVGPEARAGHAGGNERFDSLHSSKLTRKMTGGLKSSL